MRNYDFSHVDFGKSEVVRGLALAYGVLIERARKRGLANARGERQPSKREEGGQAALNEAMTTAANQ